jgi:hypothetical protein
MQKQVGLFADDYNINQQCINMRIVGAITEQSSKGECNQGLAVPQSEPTAHKTLN